MSRSPSKESQTSVLRRPTPPPSGEEVLEIARRGNNEAVARLHRLDSRDVANALQDLEPSQRLEVLELSDRVDEIIPLLSEVQFTMTLRGAGIEEAGWLVEFASPEQRIASIDLDCWKDGRFSESRFFQWVDAMIEAGPETLAAALIELDAEVWSIGMRAMGEFGIGGFGLDPEPPGGTTLDGVVFYEAYTEEGEGRIREILTAALHYAPSEYWKLVYGALPGNDLESRVWARRWQQNRLADLGFPEPEYAIRVYRPLRADEIRRPFPAESPPAPKRVFSSHSDSVDLTVSRRVLARALGELGTSRRDEIMGFILAVANTITVADRLPLADSDTPKRSLAKALRGIERGISEIATVHGRTPGSVLDAVSPRDLFRIGVTLDASLHPEMGALRSQEDREDEDWDVSTMTLTDEDLG